MHMISTPVSGNINPHAGIRGRRVVEHTAGEGRKRRAPVAEPSFCVGSYPQVWDSILLLIKLCICACFLYSLQWE